MTYKLRITAYHSDGVLTRILGVAGRRSFEPVAIEAVSKNNQFNILLCIDGSRQISLLISQLKKLVDVQDVFVVEPNEYLLEQNLSADTALTTS